MSNGNIPYDFLEYVKGEDPTLASIFKNNDAGLYEYAKSQGYHVNYGQEVSWEDEDSKIQTRIGSQTSLGDLRQTQYDKITSPNYTSTLSSMLDYGIDENSYAFLRKAYNDSLTGLLEQAYTGKARYNVDDYEDGIINNILSGVIGFLMPADILTMRVGSMAGKGLVNKLFLEGVQSKAEKVAATRGMTWTKSAMMGSTAQATVLATYEGAMGGVNAYLNDESVMSGVAGGVLHGGILGGAAGFVGGGVAAKHAKATTSLGKAATGKTAQIAYESGIFTGAQAVEEIQHGDFTAEKLLTSFLTNVGMFGLLKVQHKATGAAYDKLIKDYKKFRGIKSEENKTVEDLTDRVTKSVEEVVEGSTPEVSKGMEVVKKEVAEQRKKVEEEFRSENEELSTLERDIDAFRRDMDATMSKKDGSHKDTIYEREYISRHGTRIIESLNRLLAITDRMIKGGEAGQGAKKILKNDLDFYKSQKKEIEVLLDKVNKAVENGHKSRDVDVQNRQSGIVGRWIAAREKAGKPVKINPKTQQPFKNQLPKTKVDGKEVVDYNAMEGYSEGILGQDKASWKKEQKKIAKEAGMEVAKETGQWIEGNEARAAEKRILEKENDVFEYQVKEAGKTKTKTSKNSTIVKNNRNRMKDVPKHEQDAVIDFALSGETKAENIKNRKYTPIIADFVQWLRKGIKSARYGDKFIKGPGKKLKDVTADDVHNFLNAVVMKGPKKNKLGSSDVNPFAKFFDYTDFKAHPRGLRVAKDISYKEANEQRYEKIGGPEVFKMPKDVDKSIEKGQKNLEKEILKDDKIKNTDKVINEVKVLSVLSKIGLRAQELNKLTKANLKKEGKDYYIDFGRQTDPTGIKTGVPFIGKKHTNPKPLPISKSLFDALMNMPVKESKSQIFKTGSKIGGKSIFSKVAEAIFGEKYRWDDIRTTLQTEGITNRGVSKEQINRYLRHGEDTLEKIYTQPQLKNVLKQQKDIQKKLGINTEIKIEMKEVDYQTIESQQRDYKVISKAERGAQKEWVKKTYPHLSLKLRDTLGKKNGEVVLGKITGHLIEITKGKARTDTIPHEVTHHVVNVLKSVGSAESKALIKRGIKLFGSEEKLVQAIGEHVRGQLRQKGMIAKAKSWIKQFWNTVKKSFVGVENLSDKTIKSIVANKVLKGEVNVSHQAYVEAVNTSYQKGGKTNRELNNEGHRIAKQNKISKQRVNELREQAGWLPNSKGKWIEGEATIESLNRLNELLSRENGKGNSSKHKISDVNIQYNVSEKDQLYLLKQLRIKDLDIDKATPSQISRYTSIIINSMNKPLKEMRTSFDDQLALADISIPKLGMFKRSVMSAYDVLKNYGGAPGKRIAEKLAKIEWLQYTQYKGFADTTAKRIKDRLGRKGADAMWVIDKQRSEPLYKSDKLTTKEKWFYENMEKKGTDPYKAKKEYEGMMDYFWNAFEKEISHWAKPEQIKSFKKQFNKKYVNDYFSRRLTPEFLKEFGYDSYVLKELVSTKIDGAAKAEARALGLKDGTSKFEQKVNELLASKEFNDKIKNYIWNTMQGSRMQMKNNYLEERGILISEFKETSDGKMIRVWETKFDNTVEAYGNSMSKYLAVLRYMPEHTAIGRQFGVGELSAAKLDLIKGGNKDMGWYAQAVIERELGLEGTARDRLKQDANRKLGAVVNLNAMMGLSSPLSGIKNLLIQIPRSVAVYGTQNTLSGIAQVMRPSSWNDARMKGQLEYGTKQLTREAGEGYGFMKSLSRGVFKWNLMGITENVNRIVVSHAGKLHAQNLLGKLRGEQGMFKISSSKERIRKYFKDTLEMSDSDVKFLETGRLKTKENKQRFEELMSQAEHYSHVKSAGGTATGLLPLWATSPEGRATTLFMRMAYVTTVDSYKNIYTPAVNGNIMPLAMATIGHGLSGYALYQMYDYLFGVEPPSSHSGDLDIAMQYLWRGEFLGILGEAISPYGGVISSGLGIGQSEREVAFNPIMEPIILRNIQEAQKNFMAWVGETKTAEQAMTDWVTRSVVVAGQAQKYLKATSKHYEMDKRIKAVRKTFMADMGYSKTNGTEYASENLPYYRNMKNAIYYGTKDEIQKEVWKTYNYLMTEAVQGNAKGGSPLFLTKLHRDVVNQIISSAKWTSPLHNLSVEDVKNNRAVSIRDQFLKYLKQGGKGYDKDAKELDRYVQYKVREIKKMMYDYKLIEKYSVYPTLQSLRK